MTDKVKQDNGRSISWLGFCLSNAVTRTIVHFYPSSGPITAPYKVKCNFTLFGNGVERQTIGIDGARLAQPDGVPLDALFPALTEPSSNFYGVRIDLVSEQSRVKLQGSECIIELRSRGVGVKFRARCISGDQLDVSSKKLFLQIDDRFNQSSLLAVNASYEEVVYPVRSVGGQESQEKKQNINAYMVRELDLETTSQNHNSRWGQINTDTLELEQPHNDFAFFSMYKDKVTKRAISVCSL